MKTIAATLMLIGTLAGEPLSKAYLGSTEITTLYSGSTEITLGVSGGGGSAPGFAFTDVASDATALTTYTYSAQDIGAVIDRDYVLVGLVGRATTQTLGISSVTIAGVAANIVEQIKAIDASNSTLVAWAIASVPTGTTADIVVTFNQAALRSAVCVYTVDNIDSVTAYDTTEVGAASGSDAITLDSDTVNPSLVFGMFMGPSGTTTWAGLTEDADYIWGSSSFSSASVIAEAAETRAITADPSGTGAKAGVVIVFD